MMKTISIQRNDQPKIVNMQKILRFSHCRYPKIIIEEKVIESLFQHAVGEMHQEVGGYLIGYPVEDYYTKIRATYIKYSHVAEYISTPTHVTMNPKSLILVDQKCKETNTLLIGYYHSHPNLSVFQSIEDVNNFSMYYPEMYQVAIVIDPNMTTSFTYKYESDWIGYFMWYENEKKPIRLPKSNIVITSNWEPNIFTYDNLKTYVLNVTKSKKIVKDCQPKNSEIILLRKYIGKISKTYKRKVDKKIKFRKLLSFYLPKKS